MNNQQFWLWCQQQFRASQQKQTTTPLLMGVVNVTPDSFSDNGKYFHPDNALKQALCLVKQGADILDIGGESSRPGAKPVSLLEEMDRVIPVIERIRSESDVCISIDTSKAIIMQLAVSAGAGMINDITALSDNASLLAASTLNVPVCLMHMQGTPEIMQDNPHYKDGLMDEINFFFQERVATCVAKGLRKEQLLLDPGFGFGKSVQHNLKLIKHLRQFKMHGLPIALGVSRKSTLGKVLNKPVNERLIGGVSLHVIAALNGVSMIRTHDVEETKQALIMVQAVIEADDEIKQRNGNGSM